MTPTQRTAAILYAATAASGAAIGDEPIPAVALVMCVGYWAGEAVEQSRQSRPSVKVQPEVRGCRV